MIPVVPSAPVTSDSRLSAVPSLPCPASRHAYSETSADMPLVSAIPRCPVAIPSTTAFSTRSCESRGTPQAGHRHHAAGFTDLYGAILCPVAERSLGAASANLEWDGMHRVHPGRTWS